MDLTKYEPVIKRVLAEMKVKRDQKEDLAQECRLALLTQAKPLSEAHNSEAFAATICRHRLIDIWRHENQAGNEGQIPDVKFLSLSDPKVSSKVSKISALVLPTITDTQLYLAIAELPDQMRDVIGSLFVSGNTEEKTAENLGLTRQRVRTLKSKGIQSLKERFEVEDGN
jgi:RNA polymerase sigma factor (sigma-70 family)